MTEQTPVLDALNVAVEKAKHLDDDIDAPAIEAARALARKIDAWDVIVEWAIEDAAATESRPRVPQNDNVSLSAFLKYCESLGLTPAGRGKLVEQKPEGKGGKLAGLRSVPKPA